MNIKNGLHQVNLIFWSLMAVLFGAGQVVHLFTYHDPGALGPLALVIIGAAILWWLCRSIISAFSSD